MKHLCLLFISILVFQSAYSQNEKRIDWSGDLDYLLKELSEKHCNLFAKQPKTFFSAGIDEIKRQSEGLDDISIALKTQQLIAKLGDSHTVLNFSRLLDQEKMLPIHLYWTSDGLHILHTTPRNKEILGCQLLSINKIPVALIIDSLSTLFTADNRAVVKSRIPKVLPALQLLEYFGFTDNEQAELELMTPFNQNRVYVLKPEKMTRENRVSFKPDALAFCVKNENLFFTDLYNPDEKIYYILYNRCWSRELELEFGSREKAKKAPSFKEFEKKALNTIKSNSVDKVIFDMRYNSGGDSRQGSVFIEKLALLAKEHPAIRFYVVLGRETFSSAILNAMDFKRLTPALFVGEETSGKPNHFGQVRSFQLPSSKLTVSYSTKYFKRTDEDISTLTPDVIIETSFSDLAKGIDPIYEWIKQQ